MKNLIFLLASVYSISNGFSQEINPEKTASDYRQMSKSQQIGGIILVGGGVTALAIASKGDISFDDLPAVVILGSLATLGGTALLIAAGKNRKKSRNLSAGLSFEEPTFEAVHYEKPILIPSISLKLKF